jgi:hypothetical protein
MLYLRDRIADGTSSVGDDTLARLRKSLVDSVTHGHASYDVAFAALGAFEGTAFSAAAVTEVCVFDTVVAARRFLLELRRRLCVSRHASGLYSLHPFVAETARQAQATKATDAASRSAPVLRHVAYYGESLQAHGGYEWNIQHYPRLVAEERELVHAIDGAAEMAEHSARQEAHALRLKCAQMTSLISWYLHWRGHWDLRIRLCERVCAWAEQELLRRSHREIPGIVGNLYVDQGWIHLERDDIDRAEQNASKGLDWLRTTDDQIFATELAGQVALRRHDYIKAVEAFESLRAQTDEGSRFWLVFSYRLADALNSSGDPVRGLALLEELLRRIDASSTREQVDDVRGRILYRVALFRHTQGRAAEATVLAHQAATAFARSGIIASERRAAVMLFADLLNDQAPRKTPANS